MKSEEEERYSKEIAEEREFKKKAVKEIAEERQRWNKLQEELLKNIEKEDIDKMIQELLQEKMKEELKERVERVVNNLIKTEEIQNEFDKKVFEKRIIKNETSFQTKRVDLFGGKKYRKSKTSRKLKKSRK